jgi:hypothetical protein
MWVCFGQPFGAIAESIHNAGAKVLDNHIGPVQESLEQFPIAWRLEIKNNALLAAIETLK